MIRAMIELRRWLMEIGVEPHTVSVVVTFPNKRAAELAEADLVSKVGALQRSFPSIRCVQLVGIDLTFKCKEPKPWL